jgi:hypothetical protein
MVRMLIATAFCLGAITGPAEAAPHEQESQDIDALVRHYGAAEVEQGRVEVTRSGDVAWVRGTVEGGPWLDVWRRSAGEWRLVAELQVSEIAPIRFGGRRYRPCSRTS